MKVVLALLGFIVSFAATLMSLWRHKKYLAMTYALYRAALVIWGAKLLLSSGYAFARKQWLA